MIKCWSRATLPMSVLLVENYVAFTFLYPAWIRTKTHPASTLNLIQSRSKEGRIRTCDMLYTNIVLPIYCSSVTTTLPTELPPYFYSLSNTPSPKHNHRDSEKYFFRRKNNLPEGKSQRLVSVITVLPEHCCSGVDVLIMCRIEEIKI